MHTQYHYKKIQLLIQSTPSSSSTMNNNTNPSRSDLSQQPYPHQAALLSLIYKKVTSLKPLSQSDHLNPSTVSSSDSEVKCYSKNRAPTDNLILDRFLKNNGGYLDDSDSSDSEDLEDHLQNDLNQNKHKLRVIAKKYQSETDSNSPTSNPFIGFSLPKKIFKFNLNHTDHHQEPISTIINKQLDDKKRPKAHRPGHHPFVTTTSVDIDHLDCHQNNLTQTSKHHRYKPDRIEISSSVQSMPNKNNQTQMNAHYKCNIPIASSNHSHKNHIYHDSCKQHDKDEDWNLNLKYIQSSTFPTKNTIVDPDHHHHASLGYLSNQCRSCLVTAKNDLHLKKDKSPFRNLVLGQDDLLRSS